MTDGVDERDDPNPEITGVLLGDSIEKYMVGLTPSLIENGIPALIRAASYDLRLGEEYYQDGRFDKLGDDNPFIVIQPHGMVVVSTYEILHIPRYLIGRWNLRVGHVYRGLLWAGGPQVDPGYYGRLYCPIYNLSNRPFAIKRREHIFTIDFEKTAKYVSTGMGHKKEYDFVKQKDKLEDYLPPYPLISSVAELERLVNTKLEKMDRQISDLQSGVLIALSIVFAGLTIVATLPYVSGNRLTFSVDLASALYLTLSVAALIVSVFTLMKSRKSDKEADLKKLAELEAEYQSKAIDKGKYEKRKKSLLRRLGWINTN